MVTRISRGLAWLILAGLAAQFYLAGAALFGGLTFQPHRLLGIGLVVAAVLLLVLTLAAWPAPRTVRQVAVLTVLMVVQVALPSLRAQLPWVAGLHPVIALGIAQEAAATARATDMATSAPARLSA
jgi:hypothetical protein